MCHSAGAARLANLLDAVEIRARHGRTDEAREAAGAVAEALARTIAAMRERMSNANRDNIEVIRTAEA
jgi:hypothetical protein